VAAISLGSLLFFANLRKLFFLLWSAAKNIFFRFFKIAKKQQQTKLSRHII